MRGRAYAEDDDEYEEDPRNDGGGGDWQPNDDDDEPDDSSDSDFGSKKKAKGRKAKKATPTKTRAAKAAATRRVASKRTRKHLSSDDESEADDSDSDDDEGAWAVRPAARTGSRPRRQAAQKATANIKHTYEEEDDDGPGVKGAPAAATGSCGRAATASGSYSASYRSQAFRGYAAAAAPGYAAPGHMNQYGYGSAGYSAHEDAAVAPSSDYGASGVAADAAAGGFNMSVTADSGISFQLNTVNSNAAAHYEQQNIEAAGDQPAGVAAGPGDYHKVQPHGSRHIFIKTTAQTHAATQQYQPVSVQQVDNTGQDTSQAQLQTTTAAVQQQQQQQQRPGRKSVTKQSYKDSGSDGYDDADDDDVYGDDDDDDDDDEFEADSDVSEDDDDGHVHAADDDEDEDYQYAQQLQEQWNGLRARTTRAQRAAGSSASPPARTASTGMKRGAAWRPAGASGGGSKRSRPASQRTSTRAIAKVSYAESGDSESGDEGRGSQARREPVPALDDVGCDDEPGQNPYDEVERVLGHRDIQGAVVPVSAARWEYVEFHVKWKSYSYTHCSWEPLSALRQLGGFKRVTNYCRRAELLESGRSYLSREELELQDVQRLMEEELVEQYTQVERVVSERPDASRCLLVKWEGLPYCECTWETEADVMAAKGGPEARDAFLARQQRLQEPSKGVDAARSSFISSKRSIGEMDAQPEFLTGGKLRDYQLEGINWLTYAWIKGRNCILADEMGLGKTVQCVSFLGLLAETCGVRGPFLVVVPLSTVPNWIKEFRKWVPMLNALVYVGNGRSREVIRAFEFGGSFNQPGASSSCGSNNRSRPYNFEVLITTYELVLKDAPLLSRINWAYLMVDEAHRLKNCESALYQELGSWHFKNKLLITGTPLQNSLKELWALLHFLDPGRFSSCEEFEATYSLQDSEQVSQLHAALKPHLLRRVIKEVEKSLPPKNERILRVEMTPLQRQYYKWILARNFKELNKGARSGGHVSLLNIISELKKACNHPFLFESAEDEYRGSEEDKSVVDRLILTSGKMVLLDKLMRRLRGTGHRVLLFSQMVRVLDIISDYLRLRGWSHQRLDGSTPAAQRHAAMEAFNKPDSPDFAFLLSTRAGGLGINLATADTVIIFDSDWNPQNDLQAMSRAHRIGQTETVNIYRFVTSGSVEEEILERAKRKMVLDHLVIQRMDTSGRTVLDPAAGGGTRNVKAMFGKDELAAILRFGAEDLFKAAEEGSAERSKQLLEEDIDAILERAELVEDNAGGAAGPDGPADLLSSFNVATFKNEEDDATFWSRLIREDDRPKQEQEQPLGLRAARIKALGGEEDEAKLAVRSRSGSQEGTDAEHEDGGQKQAAAVKGKKSKRRKGGNNDPGPPVEGAVLRIDEWRWDVDESGRPLNTQYDGTRASPSPAHSLSRRDATAFVRAVRRHGLKSRLPAIAAEVGGIVEEADPPQQFSLWRSLVDGCQRALDVAQQSGKQQEGKDVTLDFFGCAVKAGELKHHLSSMSLLANRIEALTQAQQDPALFFRLEASAVPPAAKWGRAVGWTPRDDAALLLGVYYHGLGHWEAIISDGKLGLQGKLQCVLAGREDAAAGDKSVMPKASHLETRVLGILRKMLSSSSRSAAVPGSINRNTSSQRPAHLPPKKAAAARAAALAAAGAAGQRKPTPPPAAAAAAAGSAAHTPPLPKADANGSAAVTAGDGADEYGPFTAAQLQEHLPIAQDSLKQLAELSERNLEPRQVMAITKKHLLVVGHAVDRAAAANPDIRKPLWRYVIRLIKSPMSADEILKVYNRLNRQAILTAGAPQPSAAADSRITTIVNEKGHPDGKGRHEEQPAAGSGAAPAAKRPAAPLATPPSATAAATAGPGGKLNQQQQHQQQHSSLQQPTVVHAGPRRALQLHRQPEQHKQQQQQLHGQQHAPQHSHNHGKDRHQNIRDRVRGRSRSRSRDRSRQQHCTSADGKLHQDVGHRSRTHSGDRHDGRHRERSGSRGRSRRHSSESRSRSQSRGRQRGREHLDGRRRRRSTSPGGSGSSSSRSRSGDHRYRRSRSRGRSNDCGPEAQARQQQGPPVLPSGPVAMAVSADVVGSVAQSSHLQNAVAPPPPPPPAAMHS